MNNGEDEEKLALLDEAIASGNPATMLDSLVRIRADLAEQRTSQLKDLLRLAKCPDCVGSGATGDGEPCGFCIQKEQLLNQHESQRGLAERGVCRWTLEHGEYLNTWEAGCGETWSEEALDPYDEAFYCPSCGGQIVTEDKGDG